MPRPLRRVLVDTNILLRMLNRITLFVVQPPTQLRIYTTKISPSSSVPKHAEFWNVATRPADQMELGLTHRGGGGGRALPESSIEKLLPHYPYSGIYSAWKTCTDHSGKASVMMPPRATMSVYSVGCPHLIPPISSAPTSPRFTHLQLGPSWATVLSSRRPSRTAIPITIPIHGTRPQSQRLRTLPLTRLAP